MNKIANSILVAAVPFTLCAASVELASAEDFPHRRELEQHSRDVGVGADELPLIRRAPGKGQQQASKVTLAAISKLDASLAGLTWQTEADKRGHHTRHMSNAGHSLKISGDGTQVSYRAPERIDPAGVPVENRKKNGDLEKLGRAFIESKLGELVKLGDSDEIVPLKTEHEIDGRQAADAKQATEQVVASTVVFGRRYNGVDVLGAGSKIAITFANDGALLGFDMDWPEYREVGRRQRVLKVDALRSRASAFATMRFGAESVELKRFSCGYIDFGAKRNDRDGQSQVQAGCHVAYIGQRASKEPDTDQSAGPPVQLRTGVSDFIPAGETVEPDSGWPLAEAVRSRGDLCLASELSPALYKKYTPETARE